MIKIGASYKFNYPIEFVTLPEYSLQRGRVVEVVRPLIDGKEYDGPLTDPEAGELMFEIKASNGWIGNAFESELQPT